MDHQPEEKVDNNGITRLILNEERRNETTATYIHTNKPLSAFSFRPKFDPFNF